MDLNAITDDLASIAADMGYQSVGYIPEDVKAFPAAVVGDFDDYKLGETLRDTLVCFVITLAYNASSYSDAFKRIRTALSRNVDGSVVDAYHEAKAASWRVIKVKGLRGGVRLVTSGSTTALAVDLVVEIIA